MDYDKLFETYEREIRSWDWDSINNQFEECREDELCYEDDDDGNRYVFQYIGSVSILTPSGKIYAPWTTNQTEEDVLQDEAWWDALNTVAEVNGCFISWPDGCALDDIFLCKRFDTPEKEGDEE